MFKSIMVKLGFFLLQIGSNMLIKIMFGSEITKQFQELVESLENEDLTPKQKYNRAKKFLDEARSDLPDVAKNIAIETTVAKLGSNAERLVDVLKGKVS